MDVATFAAAVITLKTRFRFSVTSWFRTDSHNHAVGGQPNSTHLYGLGVDVILDDPADKPDFTAAASRFDITVLDEKDHLHCQPFRKK